jgi:hypothetical protein
MTATDFILKLAYHIRIVEIMGFSQTRPRGNCWHNQQCWHPVRFPLGFSNKKPGGMVKSEGVY